MPLVAGWLRVNVGEVPLEIYVPVGIPGPVTIIPTVGIVPLLYVNTVVPDTVPLNDIDEIEDIVVPDVTLVPVNTIPTDNAVTGTLKTYKV
jgi:hypothetical protein